MDNTAIEKVELIEKNLTDLKNMWFDVTFNTTSSVRYQILENEKN